MLALVEIMGDPTARQIAAATGLLVSRTARPGWSPVTSGDTCACAGVIQVVGRDASGGGSSSASRAIQSCNCDLSEAIRISPLAGSRRLMLSTRSNASSSSGIQPRPNTPSVGYAMTPPASNVSAAREIKHFIAVSLVAGVFLGHFLFRGLLLAFLFARGFFGDFFRGGFLSAATATRRRCGKQLPALFEGQ